MCRDKRPERTFDFTVRLLQDALLHSSCSATRPLAVGLSGESDDGEYAMDRVPYGSVHEVGGPFD